jgi:hypothetical protein
VFKVLIQVIIGESVDVIDGSQEWQVVLNKRITIRIRKK